MTKDFKQLIYCNDNSAKNFPKNLKAEELISGSAFPSSPVFQLGVQAPPGTKFYINDSEDPIMIGFTGLFDLDLNNGGSFTKLKFDEESITRIRSNDSNILIIDLLYLGGQ